MARKTNTKVIEDSTYAKIGAFLLRSKGSVKVQLVTSVNEPLKVEASDEMQKIDEITVKVNVTEDKGVNGSKIYEKTVSAEQFRENGSSPTTATEATNYTTGAGNNPTDYTNPINILKNMWDSMDKTVKAHSNWLMIVGVASAIALTLAVMGAVKLFY